MDKLESFKDIKYSEDILYVLGVIKEQKKRKPSDIVDKMGTCMTDIAFYVNHLQLTRENYGAIVREMHTKILKLQDENRELKEELESHKEVDIDFSTEQETKDK
jgi:hypothetical protein